MAKFKSCLCPLCKHVTKKYSLLGYKVRYLINIINSGDQQIFIYSLYHLKNIKSGGIFLNYLFSVPCFFFCPHLHRKWHLSKKVTPIRRVFQTRVLFIALTVWHECFSSLHISGLSILHPRKSAIISLSAYLYNL